MKLTSYKSRQVQVGSVNLKILVKYGTISVMMNTSFPYVRRVMVFFLQIVLRYGLLKVLLVECLLKRYE